MIPGRKWIRIKTPLSQLYDLINLPLPGGFLFFVFRIVSGSILPSEFVLRGKYLQPVKTSGAVDSSTYRCDWSAHSTPLCDCVTQLIPSTLAPVPLKTKLTLIFWPHSGQNNIFLGVFSFWIQFNIEHDDLLFYLMTLNWFIIPNRQIDLQRTSLNYT